MLVPRGDRAPAGGVPEVELSAVEGRSDDLGERVARGELHVAVCFQDPRQPAPRARGDGAPRPRQGADAGGAGARPPARRPAPARLEELAGDVWTAPSSSGIVARACHEAGFEPAIAFTTPDPLAIRALVAGGLAVTLVPRLLATELHGVAVVPLAGDPPYRSLYALTGAAGAPPSAHAFVDAVAAELG